MRLYREVSVLQMGFQSEQSKLSRTDSHAFNPDVEPNVPMLC